MKERAMRDRQYVKAGIGCLINVYNNITSIPQNVVIEVLFSLRIVSYLFTGISFCLQEKTSEVPLFSLHSSSTGLSSRFSASRASSALLKVHKAAVQRCDHSSHRTQHDHLFFSHQNRSRSTGFSLYFVHRRIQTARSASDEKPPCDQSQSVRSKRSRLSSAAAQLDER